MPDLIGHLLLVKAIKAIKKSPAFRGTLEASCYFTITGCVVVMPIPFMRMMYWPFGMSARLNT